MTPQEEDIIDKWILLLLWVNDNDPIKGRIRFIKEFFLFSIKFKEDLFDASQFFPYYFGPYSARVAYRINVLKSQNFITPFYKNMDWYYTLSDRGIEIAELYAQEIASKEKEEIAKIKSNNRNLGLKDLLKEIYLHYDEYTARSLIKDQVLKIEVNPDKLIKVNDGPGFVASISPEEREIILKGEAARKFFKYITE